MKAPLVAALFAAIALAGCVSEAPAEEHLNITINDVGNVPYVIEVPLWLSPDGPNATVWVEHGFVSSGQVTELHLVNTERGTAVRIVGNGTVSIEFRDVRTLTGPQFTEGAFSLGMGSFGTAPVFHVVQGDVDLVWFYEGQSEHCYLPVTASWVSPGTGWHSAHSFQRQHPSFDCLE